MPVFIAAICGLMSCAEKPAKLDDIDPPKLPTYPVQDSTHAPMMAVQRWTVVILFCLALLLCVGCQSVAMSDYNQKRGKTTQTDSYIDEAGITHRVQTTTETVETSIKQKSPNNPTEAPAFEHEETPDGGSKSSGSAGAGDGVDQALEQLAPLKWVGVALILAGGASIVLRAWLPVLPMGLSWGLIATGIGLIALPMLLDRLTGNPIILLGIVGAAGFAVAWAFGLFNNVKLFKAAKSKPSAPTPAPTEAAQ